MNNSLSYKLILITIILSLIAFVLPLIGFDAHLANTVFSLTISVGQILALMLLLKNGTLLNSQWIKLIFVFVVVIIASAVFKWIHWAFAPELLLIGTSGVSIVYIIFFLSKKTKDFLAIVKVIWVPIAFLGGALIVLKLIPDYFIWLSTFILWLAVLIDYFQVKKELTER
jgi:hypothetical protein